MEETGRPDKRPGQRPEGPESRCPRLDHLSGFRGLGRASAQPDVEPFCVRIKIKNLKISKIEFSKIKIKN